MTAGLIQLSDHAPQTVAVVYGHVKNHEYDDFLADAFTEVRRLLADQHLAPAGRPSPGTGPPVWGSTSPPASRSATASGRRAG